jgi:hypothetical protein
MSNPMSGRSAARFAKQFRAEEYRAVRRSRPARGRRLPWTRT